MPTRSAPLFVVGLGPGSPNLLTPQACQVLTRAECIAGYKLYMEMLDPTLRAGKKLISTGMRQERERCQAAIDAAMAGEETAIVSSGDPGVYAMASLALEMLDNAGLTGIIPFEVVPGVPAVCAAAAAAGAPIGHDFACISLSDLLTPLDLIQRRLHAAFEADFVCALYNPRSRGRPDYLELAIGIARQYRSPDCPIAVCRNIARAGQQMTVTPLADFDTTNCDMLTIVIVGNSQSRQAGPYMLTPRGYATKRLSQP